MRTLPTLALLASLLGCARAGPGPGVTPSESAPVALREAPAELGGWRRTEVHVLDQPGAGILYRYRGDSPLRPDVYLYPLTETARSGGTDPQARAQAESRLFKTALEIQRRRRRWDAYEIQADSGMVLSVDGRGVAGWHTEVRLVRRGRPLQSHQHLFALGDRLVKVRTTFAPDAAGEAELEGFVRELLRRLTDG